VELRETRRIFVPKIKEGRKGNKTLGNLDILFFSTSLLLG
jgi:hypothetical protein